MASLLFAVVAVAGGDPAARAIADGRVDDVAGDCIDVRGVDVDLGAWPMPLRVLDGELDDLHADVEEAQLGDVHLVDIDAAVSRARLSPSVLTGNRGGVQARGTASVTLTTGALSALLAARGFPGEVTTNADTGVLEVRLSPGTPAIVLGLDVHDGALRIRPVANGVVDELGLGVTLRVPDVAVRSVEVTGAGLRVAADFDGSPAAIACAARDTLRLAGP